MQKGKVIIFLLRLKLPISLRGWMNDSIFQADISQEAETLLKESTDARGRRLKVTRVPVPPPLYITPSEEAGTTVDIFQVSILLLDR